MSHFIDYKSKLLSCKYGFLKMQKYFKVQINDLNIRRNECSENSVSKSFNLIRKVINCFKVKYTVREAKASIF